MSITLFLPPAGPLREVAEAIGGLDAVRLCVRFGGRRLLIPRRAREAERLLDGCEPAAVRALSRRFGGSFIPLSGTVARRARTVELRRRGVAVWKIADAVSCTERGVFNILRAYRALGGTLESACELSDVEVLRLRSDDGTQVEKGESVDKSLQPEGVEDA